MTDHEFTWLPQGEKASEQERHMMQSKKIMLTTVCNPRDFHSFNLLEKGANSTPRIMSPRYSGRCLNGMHLIPQKTIVI
jgi:hypothetical protein